MGNAMRWIGTITLPWVVLAVVSAVGNWMANSGPLNESPECGTDLLTLLGTSAGAGAFFAVTAHHLAPSTKRKATLWLTVVLTIAEIAIMPLGYNTFGGVSVARCVCIIIGAWVTTANVGKGEEK